MSDVLSLGKKRAEELGLKLGAVDGNRSFYDKDDIHKLLGEACYMSCRPSPGGYWQALQPSQMETYPGDTHQALLIGIKPIVQESEERKLLREILDTITAKIWRGDQWSIPVDYFDRYVEKAKALLEKP